jgi:hypothetical protein
MEQQSDIASFNIFIFQYESLYQLGYIRLQRYQRRHGSRNKNTSRDAWGKENETVLLTLHLILHLALLSAALLGYIRFEPVILLYSFIAGVVCISFYLETGTNEKKRRRLIREFLIDGESASAVALRKFTEPLFLRSASCNS